MWVGCVSKHARPIRTRSGVNRNRRHVGITPAAFRTRSPLRKRKLPVPFCKLNEYAWLSAVYHALSETKRNRLLRARK